MGQAGRLRNETIWHPETIGPSLQNYANDVVATIQECCQTHNIQVPTLISERLNCRGMKVDLNPLQIESQKLKELEEERSNLQAKGKLIGKEVGQKIKAGNISSSEEIKSLRIKGNLIKQKVNSYSNIHSY